MKTNQIIPVTIILFFLSVGFMSCSSTRTAVSCPEFTVKKSDFNGHLKKKNSHKFLTENTRTKNKKVYRSEYNKTRDIKVASKGNQSERNFTISKLEYSKGLIASTDKTFHPTIHLATITDPQKESIKIDNSNIISTEPIGPCDTIFLKSGAIILGKVEEIGQTEVKYRRCNNLTGPIISILKSDISRIQYINGTSEYFTSVETITLNKQIPQYYNTSEPKTEGLGLAGFIASLVGLLVAGIPLGIIAIIFGGISLSKIKKNPQRHKGKGFAIASIIIGLIDVVAVVILIATLV